jgi:hypothetical protein
LESHSWLKVHDRTAFCWVLLALYGGAFAIIRGGWRYAVISPSYRVLLPLYAVLSPFIYAVLSQLYAVVRALYAVLLTLYAMLSKIWYVVDNAFCLWFAMAMTCYKKVYLCPL